MPKIQEVHKGQLTLGPGTGAMNRYALGLCLEGRSGLFVLSPGPTRSRHKMPVPGIPQDLFGYGGIATLPPVPLIRLSLSPAP
jgi:hypothetical protein